MDYQEVKVFKDENQKHIHIKLRPGDMPNQNTLKIMMRKMKEGDREYENVIVDISNKRCDQVNMNGIELQEMIDYMVRRYKYMNNLTLNLEYWGNMSQQIQYTIEPIQLIHKNLLSLTIFANSRSMTPSISNKALKDLGVIIALLVNCKYLHLEFGESSPERRKLIKEDGLKQFFESFKDLKKLKVLILNLDNWMAYTRSKIKNENDNMIKYFGYLINNKDLVELKLSMKCWEAIGYKPLSSLFKNIKNQKYIKKLGLSLFNWSYYNDSFKEECIINLLDMIESKKKLTYLCLDIFDLGGGQQLHQHHLQRNDDSDSEFEIEKQQKKNDLQKQMFIVSIMNKIVKLQSLQTIDLRAYQYIPRIGTCSMRNTILNLKYLTTAHLKANIPIDDEIKYFKRCLMLPVIRKRLIHRAIVIKKKINKKFRVEILQEMLTQFENI